MKMLKLTSLISDCPPRDKVNNDIIHDAKWTRLPPV